MQAVLMSIFRTLKQRGLNPLQTIVSALSAAGVQGATAAEVQAASQQERTNLPALANLGNGITAFEALVIAADLQSHGGFHLGGNVLDQYLQTLLNIPSGQNGNHLSRHM